MDADSQHDPGAVKGSTAALNRIMGDAARGGDCGGGRHDWVWYLGLALALVTLGVWHVDAPVRPHHEGTVIYPALLIKHGARPLTDVAIQHPPMTAYVYAAGMGIGGERLVVTRWITLGAVTLEALLVAWLIAQVAGVGVGAVAALVWAGTTQLIEYLFLPWSTHYGVICVLLALGQGLRWCDRPALRRLIWMGAWLGLSLAFRVNLGAAALGACVLGLAWVSRAMGISAVALAPGSASACREPWWRPPCLVLAVAGGTALALAGAIALHVGSMQGILRAVDFQRAVASERSFSLLECLSLDGAGLWTASLILVCALGLLGMSQPRPALAMAGFGLWLVTLGVAAVRPPGAGGIDSLKLVPGLVGIVVCYLWWWRRDWRTPWHRRLVFILAAAGATWSVNFPLPGLPQAMWATSGALIAAMHVAGWAIAGLPARRQVCLWLAVVVTLLVFVPSRGRTRGDGGAGARVASGFCGGMRGEAEWVTDHAALRERVQSLVPPGASVLVWRMQSLLYADLERPAAALPVLHFDRFTARMASGGEVMRETLERLQRTPPRAVVIDTHHRSDAFPDWYRGTFGPVADWLARRYTSVWVTPHGLFRVLTPGEPPVDDVEVHFRRMLLDFAPGDLLRDVSRETEQVLEALVAAAESRDPRQSSAAADPRAAGGENGPLAAERGDAVARVLGAEDRRRGLAAVEACLVAYRLVERDGVPLTAEQKSAKDRWLNVAAGLRQDGQGRQ